MLTIRAMVGGKEYAGRHLVNNDYYSVGETIDGQWMGKGAEKLGLVGKVDLEHFEQISQGNHPHTGEYLRPRHSADRYDSDGKKIQQARSYFDLTLSAPKGVSVHSMEDERLKLAHREAVDETVKEIEALAATRIRKQGANKDRETESLVVARFDHDTSRELDPQLHTHLVVANLTYDPVEQRWKALQPSEFYAQSGYITEVYRNALARKVAERGYLVKDQLWRGRDQGFTIEGIESKTIEKYSQRSHQKNKAIAEFIENNGRQPTNNEVSVLVRDTRQSKLAEIATAEVKALQRERLSPEEAETLSRLKREALERGSVRRTVDAAPSLTHAREHVFERVSVAKDYEVKAEALRHGRGEIDLGDLKRSLSSEIAAGRFLSVEKELATKESLRRERKIISEINSGIGIYEPLGRNEEIPLSDSLRLEQRSAVRAVLESRDFAFNLNGAAGTGKTATLREIKRTLQEAKRGVVAVAPTKSAVDELQHVGYGNAMSIPRLLVDQNEQQNLQHQVLIVDEAGMVSSKDMESLIDLAKASQARIVFSGDTKQIKSVEEGDALRILERESNLKGVSLRDIQRQTNAEYKAAIKALRNNAVQGYERLDEMGAIWEVPWLDRMKEVAKAYHAASAVPNIEGGKRSVLVVAATHDHIHGVTHEIRRTLKEAGALEDGLSFTRHAPLNWTDAQKKRHKNYEAGQILEFHRASGSVKKLEHLEVIAADKHGIAARRMDGSEARISYRQTRSFGVFERQEIEVAPNDRLLLQTNWKDKSFRATNGELVTVASVENGRIGLTDGRTLPEQLKQFNHGYAVTAHKSQGKTVDFAVIAAEHMSHDLFYVSASRAREGVTVVTSDSERLQTSIGASGERQSATELARKANARFEQDDYKSYRLQQGGMEHGKGRSIHYGTTNGIDLGF